MIRLTRAQVREIDRRAIDEYGIPGIVLMENAARAVVEVAMEMLEGIERPSVRIFCGGGNNGGDGLAIARHLHTLGMDVLIALAAESAKYSGDALTNLRIAMAMKIPHCGVEDVDNTWVRGIPDLVIDAIFGTGLSSPPRDTLAIDLINEHPCPALAVDLPSGMDCDTGQALGVCVRAKRTVTFVAEKVGFSNPQALRETGEITVGDIGCPRELIEKVAKS